jgi:predicted RNA-binding Zn ribbon-like protein
MDFGISNDVEFDTDTEWLCLSFANTADWHASDQPVEGLKSYWDLLNWGVTVEVLSREKASQLAKIAEDSPVKAESVLRSAIELREAIYRIFSAVANLCSVNTDDLQILDLSIQKYYPLLQISGSDNVFGLSWPQDSESLDQVLWPVIQSAIQLLTSERLDRVGQCDDDRGCGWLFYDTSRNKSRRWCSMETCGNRAKVHRHYEKQRTTP